MDKADYITEGNREIGDTQFHEATDTDLTGEAIWRANLYAREMLQRSQISDKVCSYLTVGIDRTQPFYMLHMIYKNLEHFHGRPIASGTWYPLKKLTICGSLYWPSGTILQLAHWRLLPYDKHS